MPSSFLAYISDEQARVNAALKKEIDSQHPLVRPVLRHVLLSGGKRVRPALAALSARLLAPDLSAGEPGGGAVGVTGSAEAAGTPVDTRSAARRAPDRAPDGATGRAAGDVPGRAVSGVVGAAGAERLETRVPAGLEEDYGKLGVALELLHGASLLHDDIIDAADLRRGRPTAHKIYGLGTVVLAGDILLAKSVQLVAELGQNDLSKVFARAITETAAGEIAELAILRNVDLGIEEYLDIIKGKTAWLLRASCELGARLAGAGDEAAGAMADYGHNLGMAFQMVDDALDFSPCSKDTGKPVGGDLREGKLTPPLRLYYASLSGEERDAFAAGFQAGGFSAAEVISISEKIREQGFADRTRVLAEKYLQKARTALSALPWSRHGRKEYGLLLDLLDYIGSRRA